MFPPRIDNSLEFEDKNAYEKVVKLCGAEPLILVRKHEATPVQAQCALNYLFNRGGSSRNCAILHPSKADKCPHGRIPVDDVHNIIVQQKQTR